MKRDPSKEPRVGDRWKAQPFEWIIVNCDLKNDKYQSRYVDEKVKVFECNLSNIHQWSKFAEFLGNNKEQEEMIKRDPITNPQAGDYWTRPSWKQIVVFSEGDRVLVLEKCNEDGREALWDTSVERFKKAFIEKDRKFIGNYPEKMLEFQTLNGIKMESTTLTTVIILGKDFKENLAERERAIVNPQSGDRWIWGDGVSVQVSSVYFSSYDEKTHVYFETSKRENRSRSQESWHAYVHAAIFVGNFAPKTETKRDPKKNPRSGDKWQTTIFYHNNMYDGTTKGITAGSTLMISEVANRESDTFVYGYFTDGTKFICPMKEFEARTQSLKFVE